MTSLSANRQRHEFPRRFLQPDLTIDSYDAIQPLFAELGERTLETAEQVERWLADLSELSAALHEEMSARYIEMTCRTDDPELEKKYLYFLQEVMPKAEPEFVALNKKYLAAPGRAGLSPERFHVYDRARKNEVELFREENIPLQTEDDTLAQQYQRLCGDQTAVFDGQEQTMPQLMRYMEQTDCEKRRAAWTAAVSRRLADREKVEEIFDRMIALRHQMALNAGFENYLEYQFQRLGRFDYGVADCEAFHTAVREHVMPLRRQMREERRRQLGLEKLAPYDLDVDPENLPPLTPFQTAEELIDGTDRIFAAVSPEFQQDFAVLKNNELLDLESRKGKAPGGYQSTLDEARLPFIFMNATGRNQDVFTLLHEGGHAFHALAYREEPLHSYRNAPIEFCEVASMGMEMMACERLESFYSPEDARRARIMHLEDVLILLPWIARVDAMQHWIYRNPTHTRQQRVEHWLELEKQFGDDLDWSELGVWRECSWIAQLHFFCVPLYYIEYGIAQLGALQLWTKYLDNPAEAVRDYRAALALGNTRPLPELFAGAGLRFAFDAETIAPLMDRARHALDAA